MKNQPLLFILLILIVTILTACAQTPHTPQHIKALSMAKTAIDQNKHNVAYYHLKNLFLNINPEIRDPAIIMANSTPKITIAGESWLENHLFEHGKYYFSNEDMQNIASFRKAAYASHETTNEVLILKAIKPDYDFENTINTLYKSRSAEMAEFISTRDVAKNKQNDFLKSLIMAKSKATIHCLTKDECEKAFELTQIYVNTNADMKIQVATGSIIETYNPTDDGKIGIKATKTPSTGTAADIKITVSCKDSMGYFKNSCNMSLLSIYQDYPVFVKNRLR